MKLTTKILLGLVSGAAVGAAVQAMDSPVPRDLVLSIEPLGIAFIRLISMVVVPLVVASLLIGICSVGDVRRLGRMGGKTLGYFLLTTVAAATIGLSLAVLMQPGRAVDSDVRDRLTTQYTTSTQGRVANAEAAAEDVSLLQRALDIIPRNPVASAVNMDLLSLIFFTLLFGSAVSTLAPNRRTAVLSIFEGINGAMGVIIDWVMHLAPYAVFILIAGALARFGIELLQGLLAYAALVIVGEMLHAMGVLTLALRLNGIRVLTFWRHIADAPILAFATASSNAALPVSLEVAEEKLGVSNAVASFVLPIGATLNMNGSALYKGITAVFLAQVYGIPLGPGEYLTIIVVSTMAALAGVGVPGSSLVTTLVVLSAIGMGPQAAAGIALVAGVDRFLDMFRTSVNVLGDLTATAIIAKSEGEQIRGIA